MPVEVRSDTEETRGEVNTQIQTEYTAVTTQEQPNIIRERREGARTDTVTETRQPGSSTTTKVDEEAVISSTRTTPEHTVTESVVSPEIATQNKRATHFGLNLRGKVRIRQPYPYGIGGAADLGPDCD